ncbi:SPFH/Band 7/PHB domain protein [Parahaliea sp. F7430]|uniref:SPFH/Band 7/PHB domain protein n=1 Tax=Sediminihaliea albiluteola TaxID=2758564 RepID=A0A7W2TWS9_9GAMM|nr:SPFH domain-containing protein [Sediminihaliea albiluteola]MBA6413351.1 SPFH/Band 7/PHB domain protein [Sediminihaliea albiluteola]
MTMAAMVVLGFIAFFVVTLLVKGIRIVPEQSVMMIERLGRYHKTLTAGLNIIIPVVDQPRLIPWRRTVKEQGQKFFVVTTITNLDLREQVYDFPSQSVITRDNVGIQVDAVVYFQITVPRDAVYEIENLPIALETLTQTTLRNVIGEMDLDDTLTSREKINASLVDTIGSAAQSWGIKVNRVEVQDIIPPTDVLTAMEQQMKAERERRARVTEAEGFKRAEVLRAEGERDARIATAEGERQAYMLEAEGEAGAIERLAQAEQRKLQLVKEVLQEDFADYLVGIRYMQTLEEMAKNQNVVWMPHSATDLASFIGGYKHLLGSQALAAERAESTSGERP